MNIEYRIPIGIPLNVWHCQLTVEFDRDLPLVEEMILHFLTLGITDVGHMQNLLGIDRDAIMNEALVELIRKTAVLLTENDLDITDAGRALLEKAQERKLEHIEVEVYRNPFTDELSWEPEGELSRINKEFRESGTWLVDAEHRWTERDLIASHQKLQQLIQKEGLPNEPEAPSENLIRPTRELISIRPLRSQTVVQVVDLDVQFDHETPRLSWSIHHQGKPVAYSKKLRELTEAGKVEVLPYETRSSMAMDPLDAPLKDLLRQRPDFFEPAEEDWRESWGTAIAEAKKHITLVYNFMAHYRFDAALLSALYHQLNTHENLKVHLVLSNDPYEFHVQGRNLPLPIEDILNLQAKHPKRVKFTRVKALTFNVLSCDDRFLSYTTPLLLRGDADSPIGLRYMLCLESIKRQEFPAFNHELLSLLKTP